jgi:hypothetical protein
MSPRPVRRTQAITPFGVGAMIDFPGPVSLIHCGLDSWPFKENDKDHREFRIEDENRLAIRLGVKYFVQPPDFRYQHGHGDIKRLNLNLKIPFLRFPKWHVCPRCGLMHEAALHDWAAPICRGPVGSGKDKGKSHSERKTIQVRFIAACPSGHLQDFPWWEWVLGASTPQQQGRLRMVTSGSASLAGVRIVCEEDSPEIKITASKTLSGAFEFSPGEPSALSRLQIFCRGENPALGIPSPTYLSPGCGNHLYPLLRGGSNVYFPHIVSSIYLPPVDVFASDEVLEILEDSLVWSFLSMSAQCTSDGKVNRALAKTVLKKYYPDREVDPDKLVEAANKRLVNENKEEKIVVITDTPEQAFRREEYELFSRDVKEGYPKTNLLIRSEDIASYEPVIRDCFQQISLLHKLRETRVFVGFSRIFPEDNLDNNERRALISRTSKEWLPGVIVRGEGIFLQIREDKIQKWLATHNVELENRIRPIKNTLDQIRETRHQQPLQITPRFVLLHTLSHLLINELIYECGYGSASLRERLYSAEGDHPMSGILLYTAAGDSEGTMGGLVRMGKSGRLEGVLRRALENARWCSTDPVCIESQGQGPDNCNLAACHSCALLPETSCEEMNRLLDRGLVIGTLSEPELGFFSELF